jgi:polyisoprenoid-binding protein YceI
MKKGILYSLAIAGTMIFASCGSETEEVVEKEPLEICFYAYDSLSTELTWTAYKTSAKVPVGGTFDDIQITSDGSSDDPTALLESMKFSIKTASVNSANAERDPKIAKFFFETINTSSIDGRLKKLKDGGKAIVEISMNGVKADVEGDYTFED